MLLGAAFLIATTSSASVPERVLVLGPHHSGTSIAARALGAEPFGLHLGEPSELLLDDANPLKFWERKDVVDANQKRLSRGTRDPLTALPSFVGYGFDPAVGTPLNASADARAALNRLEARRPWATKDPRLSLLAAEWLAMLPRETVCVITVRHPLDFASSMLPYAKHLALSHWSAIWLRYMASALQACAERPQALVLHEQLVRQPASALAALHARLHALGVPLAQASLSAEAAARLAGSMGLDTPPPLATWTPAEMAAAPKEALALHAKLANAAATGAGIAAVGSDEKMKTPSTLVSAREVPRAVGWPALPATAAASAPHTVKKTTAHAPKPTSSPSHTKKTNSNQVVAGVPATTATITTKKTIAAAVPAAAGRAEAYATLLTTADGTYLAGALALGSSIRALDTAGRPMLCLMTPDVPKSWHAPLRRAGWTLTHVEPLDEFWWGTSEEARCHRYTDDQHARWGHMATKLRLFTLTSYDALLYLDADALLTNDPEPLFARVRRRAADNDADDGSNAGDGTPRAPSSTARSTDHNSVDEVAPLVAEAPLAGAKAPFNAGVLALAPSDATFAALLARAALPPPTLYNNSVDCTEQALLNAHFDGSTPGRTAGTFAVAHAAKPTASHRDAVVVAAADAKEGAAAAAGETDADDEALPAVTHWITLRCPKPWDYVPVGYGDDALATDIYDGEGKEEEEENQVNGKDASAGVVDMAADDDGSTSASSSSSVRSSPRRLPSDCDESLYDHWWRVYRRVGYDALALHAGRGGVDDTGSEVSFVGVHAGWRRRAAEYSGCSVGCPEEWVDDGACDAPCNNEACNYDGKDCYHDAGECYKQADGWDYRGHVKTTKTGRECQAWSAQSPNHHTMTLINYPTAGLGGHNYCRNPDHRKGGPWCYTLDFPAARSEACDVGAPSEVCDAEHHALPGGAVAPVVPKWVAVDGLTIGTFVDGTAHEAESVYYQVGVPPGLSGLKVVLVPINGDSDLFLSFDHERPTRTDAAFVVETIGVKQFVLPSYNPHFCAGAAPTVEQPCTLYLTVSGFESGDFKLAVYNYTSELASADGEGGGGGVASAAWSCSEGCDELRLGNQVCDVACNTSACVYDQGDCGYTGEYALDEMCTTGCATSWKGDGFCDEACFNAACDWDDHDCTAAPAGCADGCLPNWIDDEECDELCHHEACGWDGADCDHHASDCYTSDNGADYRGQISHTESGKECQLWSHQAPHAHTFTHLTYPHAGLGGHNYCRNPGGTNVGPWCFTTDPAMPTELCEVPPATEACEETIPGAVPESVFDETPHASLATERFKSICPVDCEPLLGNGHCEIRCNISSCLFDAGDCGIGKSLKAILADQGYVVETPIAMYVLVGVGVLGGLAVGLLVLKMTLAKIKKEELQRRGYTHEEARGMDGAEDDF